MMFADIPEELKRLILKEYAANPKMPEDLKAELAIEVATVHMNRSWSTYMNDMEDLEYMLEGNDDHEPMEEEDLPQLKTPTQRIFEGVGEDNYNTLLCGLMMCNCCERHTTNRPTPQDLPDFDMTKCCQAHNYRSFARSARHRKRRARFSWITSPRIDGVEPEDVICTCPCRHYLRHFASLP